MREWLTLLMASILMFNGTLAVYAQEGTKPIETGKEYIGQQDAKDDDTGPEDAPTEREGEPEWSLDGDGDSHKEKPDFPELTLPNGQEEGLTEPPDEISPKDMDTPNAFASAKGKYYFVVADPGGSDYRKWSDPLLLLGEAFQYDLYLAWYENGEFEIVSTLEEDMGIAFTYEGSPFYNIYWDENGYHIEFTATQTGEFQLDVGYTRPDNGKRVEYWFDVGVVQHRYAFVVSDPGSGNYREWDNPTIREGDNARYALHLARMEDGGYHVTDPNGNAYIDIMNWEIEEQLSEDFAVAWEGDGYYLRVRPNGRSYYEIELRFRYPDFHWSVYPLLQLHVRVDGAEYAFVITEINETNYRPWEDLVVRTGHRESYELHFARIEEGAYKIVSLPRRDLGIDFAGESYSEIFELAWSQDGYRIRIDSRNITAAQLGTHAIACTYTHPDTGERMEFRPEITVEESYVVVVAEPGGDRYREWVPPFVQVGEVVRYSLRLASGEAGNYHIATDIQSTIGYTEDAHFAMDWEKDGYTLSISPTQAGMYAIPLHYTGPGTGQVYPTTLYFHAMDQNPDDALLTVIAPNGTQIHRREEDVGSITVYYDKVFDPEQTLTIVSGEEWSLHDPEGVLSPVSTDVEKTEYTMVKPTWEQPCEFRSGGRVVPVFILMPGSVSTRFAIYDKALANTAPQRLTKLEDSILVPGVETQVSVLMEVDGETILLRNPLSIVHTDRPVTAVCEPDAPFFTLIPEETGRLTLGIQRGRSETVWVESKTQADILFAIDYGYWEGFGQLITDGDILSTRIRAVIDLDFEALPAQMARSSNPNVIAIELDQNDADSFYLNPVGFGESVIYLESDEYYCEVTVAVRDRQIPITAVFQDPTAIGLPASAFAWGREILPRSSFEGTNGNPFIIPCITSIAVEEPSGTLFSPPSGIAKITSSDPGIVEVVQVNGFEAYLMPVGAGTCTITYQEGPLLKEVVVRSEPDSLQQVGCVDPGFYTYYGSAHIRRETVSLENGLAMPMAIASYAGADVRVVLDSARFHFSTPGVAKVNLLGNDMFELIPVGDGTTSLTYTTQSGRLFELHISVGLPETAWDFVVRDSTDRSGYRLWEGEQAIVSDHLDHEVFFAQVILSGDGSIHTVRLLDFPEDVEVVAQDPSAFHLVQRESAWYVWAEPRDPGEYTLSITAVPEGSLRPVTWEKHLYVTQPLIVAENTVAAINEAIRTAPVTTGIETVILLPEGYIPMDGDTPVLLDRPVTLRGQNTVLASDVAALCYLPGAKLQNLTIQFDDASVYNGSKGYEARRYNKFSLGLQKKGDSLFCAVYGDGFINLDNCELVGGTGYNWCQYGIAILGDGLAIQGANSIQSFSEAGWVVYSRPGPRLYASGLAFTGNKIGVRAINKGSTDPYFIRLTESNFMGNAVNVQSNFPANFSHNYFDGGNDADNITKSPQYTESLSFGADNMVADYPNLRIEEERLTCTELLNFEGRSPIDAANFVLAADRVQINVRELDSGGVDVEDNSNVLLTWSFAPSQILDAATIFRPDADINESFTLPANSGIEQYQGVSFAHHGPLPMDGAEISVQKKVLFQETVLHLYRLTDGSLTYLGEIENTADEFYTFFLDGCSDYVITNVVVELAGGGDENKGDNGNGGDQGDNSGGGAGEDKVPGGENSTSDNKSSRRNTNRNIPDSNTIPENRTDPFSDNIQDTPYDSPNGPHPEQTQSLTPRNADAVFGLSDLPAGEMLPGNDGHADYAYIPAPAGQMPASKTISANRYIDDTAIRSAFENPGNGQVIMDVSVRTVISPLAFQLLAENPELILVLKGDGYEWCFPGANILGDVTQNPFDTYVNWNTLQDGAYAQLSIGQQLPGSCELVLEMAHPPREWAVFSASISNYMPCELNIRQQGTRLRVALDARGDYVALM